MNPLDDDYDDMVERRTEIDDGGSGLPPGTAALTLFFDDLRTLGIQPPPEPSTELAALFSGAVPLGAARRRLAHPRAVIAGAAAVAVLATTGAAAANDSLPQPAQRFVSRVINLVTPFHVDPSPHPGTPVPEIPVAPAQTPSSSTPDGNGDDTNEPTRGRPDESSSAPELDDQTATTAGSTGDDTSRSEFDDAASAGGDAGDGYPTASTSDARTSEDAQQSERSSAENIGPTSQRHDRERRD